MTFRALIPAVLVALALCPAALADEPPRMAGIEMVEAWPGAEFKNPIGIVHAGDGSDRLYVIEKAGRVLMLPKWRGVGPVPSATTFLDIRDRVHAAMQGGIMGLAFHPRYAQNGKIYASYVQTHSDARAPALKFKLVVSEMTARGGKADPSTTRVLLEIPKKFPIHQAGRIRFGPDGLLYIATGDGGSKYDADGEAQNPRGMLGKMLRIDVDGRTGGKAYGIPPRNPWPNMPGRVRPEIYAFGFRNPWGFDWNEQKRLFTTEPGSTGPESREWIMEVTWGGNHGWPFNEGKKRLKAPPPHIDANAIVKPAFEWVRGQGDSGTAGIGGRFYRGSRLPSLRGKYVFGDFMRGQVYAIDLGGAKGKAVGTGWQLLGEVPDVAGVGSDAQGEVYFPSFELGMVFTLTRGG